MRTVQKPQRLCPQASNDVMLAPQERMTMQTAVDGATLLQQQAEWHLVVYIANYILLYNNSCISKFFIIF